MNRTRTLLDLQTVDAERDQAVTRLKEVMTELAGDTEIDALRRRVAELESQVAEIERRLRSNNLEREGVKEHIAAEEKKLYGGSVKNPKELQNLELEVKSLRRRLSDLDDVSLEIMLNRDEAAAAFDGARESLEEAETAAQRDQQTLTAERTALARRIRDLDNRRKDVVSGLEARDLSLYEQVRRQKVGKAVAVVKKDTCGECGMQLPRNLVGAIVANNGLVQCPTCRRILVS